MEFALVLLAIYCAVVTVACIGLVYFGRNSESADDYHD